MDNFINDLVCGNCVDVMNSMPANSVDLLFADPPYFLQLPDNCIIRRNLTVVNGCHDEWDKFSSFKEYDDFTKDWLTAAKRVLKPNGSLWVIGAYSNIFRVGSILQDLGYWILNDVIWTKNNPLPNLYGTRFCNAHETLIWAVKNKNVKNFTFHYKDLKAGNEDKQMRSDWELSVCSGGERVKDENGFKAHSTQKPEALLHRIIAATTNSGDLVFDPFVGSGTSASVAKKLGRNYFGCDLEESYIEMSKRRLESVHCQPLVEMGDLIGKKPQKLPFINLIESGYLQPNKSQLQLRHNNKVYTAVVHENGTITQVLTSDDCGTPMRGSIHQVGKHIMGTPSCNGWTAWEYYDTQLQNWKSIDNLRSLALKNNG